MLLRGSLFWGCHPAARNIGRRSLIAEFRGLCDYHVEAADVSPFHELLRLSELVYSDAKWCILIHMDTIEKTVRQSVSLPSPLAKRVKALAKSQKVSSNRILVDLVETGLRSKEEEKRKFFELADRLSISTDAKEQQELKDQLARMTFGE
ncbi:MAG: hypothetical protein C0402_00175 [Thermodesulfovibrio sp.]|nr:hypothetical protein [Thermodesulfovibrio sp.]